MYISGRKLYIENNTEKTISFTLAYMVSFLALLNCVNGVTEFIGLHTQWDTIVCYFVLISSILHSMLRVVTKGKAKAIWFFPAVFLLAFTLITAVIYPENRPYFFSQFNDIELNPMYILYVYSFPGFVFIQALSDYTYFKKILIKFSYVVVFLSSFVYFFSRSSFAGQYMTLSYNMLLQLMVLIVLCKGKRSIINILLIVIGSVVVIVGGARGAMLSLVVGLIICVLFDDYNQIKKLKLICLLVLSAILIIVFYNSFIQMTSNLLNKYGIQSRTLLLLISNELNSSSGRMYILHRLSENLNLLGYGLYGDRALLAGSVHLYAHNLFLEWLIQYGMILGGLFSILYIGLLITSLKSSNKEILTLLLTFIPSGFVLFLTSGSYLNQVPSFYILFGLMLIAHKHVNVNRNKIQYMQSIKSNRNEDTRSYNTILF